MTVLNDPEQNRGPEVLLGLPTGEGGREIVGVALFDEKVDALSGELPLRNLEEAEDDIAGLDRVGGQNEFKEPTLEVDRDLFGDFGQVALVGDEAGLSGFVGRLRSDKLREIIADCRSVETFGGVELVAVPHGLGEASENGDQIFLGGGLVGAVDQFFGKKDAAAGRPGAGKLLHQLVFG